MFHYHLLSSLFSHKNKMRSFAWGQWKDAAAGIPDHDLIQFGKWQE
jgi:hypothetical protein